MTLFDKAKQHIDTTLPKESHILFQYAYLCGVSSRANDLDFDVLVEDTGLTRDSWEAVKMLIEDYSIHSVLVDMIDDYFDFE